ncbi:MAG: hypothetical protein AAGK78_06890, partial [Planctomycetota bacterium]
MAAAAALAMTAGFASGAVVYSEDFETFGGAEPVPGFDVTGGFNDRTNTEVVTDGGGTANGTVSAFFDTNGSGFPTTTQFVVDTGVAFETDTTYTLALDVFKGNTGFPYEGDVFYEVYVGDPSADGSTGTLIAGGSVGGAIDGNVSVTGSLASGSGTVFLRFDSTIPSNTPDYAQVELDNISLDATPIPEPAMAGLGLLGLAALRR